MKYLDDTGLGYFWNKLKAKIASITRNDLASVREKEYTGIIGSANDQAGASFYFGSVRPTTFYLPFFVKYRITANDTAHNNFKHFSEVSYYGAQTVINYSIYNTFYSTSYRSYYYHNLAKLTAAGYTAGYGHILGVGLRSSKNPTSTSYKRNFKIEILETMNCEVTIWDSMKKIADITEYNETNYGGITEYNGASQGYQETGDANDNTIPSGYCTTAAATAAKAASCTNYNITNHSFLQVIMQYANTAEGALTLNVNSKGAKPIYINGRISSATNYTLPAGSYFISYVEDSREPNGAYYFRTDGKLSASITGDCSSAEMVNGHIVEKDVPSDAKFTDTTYVSRTAESGGTDLSLVTTGEKYIWNNKQNALTFDTTPTTNSISPVTSNGIKNYVDNVILQEINNLKSSISFIDLTNIEPVITPSYFQNFNTYTYTYQISVDETDPSTYTNEYRNMSEYFTYIINLASSLKYDENAEFTPLPLILYIKEGNNLYNCYIQAWNINNSETETSYTSSFTSNELMILNCGTYNFYVQGKLSINSVYNYNTGIIQFTVAISIIKQQNS